ncbi:MAG TPA: hypothetical protein VGS59_14275 [Candidatus Acidoferrales bacterium]|nr:hypothetical protein [Candidatus Acidoferrales bacterium]
MRFNASHLYRYVLVGGALVALGCAPSGAWAQQNGDQDQTQGMAQGQVQGQFQARSDDWVAFDQFLDAHPDIANALKANPDLLEDENFRGQHQDFKQFCDNHPRLRQDLDQDRDGFHHRFQFRHEVAAMDLFLDGHPFIDSRLEANPSLINDKSFVQANVALRDFLNSHPQVRQAFDQNPALFMRAENRFEGTSADIRGNVFTYNQFAKDNPNIAKQLAANPSLVNDSTYVNAHVSLKAFLTEHPEVQQQIAQNPGRFFQMVASENNMGDRGDNGAGRGRNPNPDLTRGEVAGMDQFLDQHADIEQQLQANPSLIKNQDFLQAHPQLQTFLNDHPRIQEEFAENPTFFMNRENRYENSPTDRAADNRGRNPNPDLTRGEVAGMDQFLDQHADIEQQLQANPSLINNTKYLNNNPQLRAFLSAHPQVREEFTENPSYFMHREGQFENTENSSGIATMDAYLDKHAEEARDLNAYPARINDSDYLAHHKDLGNFLKGHPEVREQFSHNPSAFMHQESAFDASAQMDDFLDNHKNIRRDLDQNPETAKDDNYLDHHKDLKAFLAKNPGVSDQFEGNPNGFMDNERKFDADRQMDFYLTKHKNVAKDLQKDPDRVKDAKYLDHHKDLKQLMDEHPELAERAHTNPAAFMQEQMKFHEQYKNQQVQQKTKVEERAKTHGVQ